MGIERDVVFVSHANPEDDAFATWLAIRLVRTGYRVWCDKTNLLAGENFWNDIEAVIRRGPPNSCTVSRWYESASLRQEACVRRLGSRWCHEVGLRPSTCGPPGS